MFTSIHQPLATVAVVAAVGGGSAAISAAADDDTSTKASSTSATAPVAGHGRAAAPSGNAGFPGERALTGETADKVEEAALAEVAGGTIVRVETDANHGSPYEAHVRKPDGTEVEVLVDKDFEVTRVIEMRRP
jgi:uncharacterized membrane protein YkoI